MPKYRPLKLSDCMPFGKYKDEQIEDLIYSNPNYLAWCIQEEVCIFDQSVIEILEERKIV